MNIDNYRIVSPGLLRGRIDWIVILRNILQIKTERGLSHPELRDAVWPAVEGSSDSAAWDHRINSKRGCYGTHTHTHRGEHIWGLWHTIPFKFIHEKDGQAHQHHGHQHDDCSAAVDAVAGVHQRSFEEESKKEKLSAHASLIRTNPFVRGPVVLRGNTFFWLTGASASKTSRKWSLSCSWQTDSPGESRVAYTLTRRPGLSVNWMRSWFKALSRTCESYEEEWQSAEERQRRLHGNTSHPSIFQPQSFHPTTWIMNLIFFAHLLPFKEEQTSAAQETPQPHKALKGDGDPIR